MGPGRCCRLKAAAAAVLGLCLAPSPVLARGVTRVPSDIPGVENHFPAGLFNWSSSGCGDGGIDFCGTLDFCQDGDRFGYALPGETCQPYNGPTIRLIPGSRYRLTLRNTSTVSTNIHTHGLHIVGSGDSDDATRSVGAGECLDYTWDITDDHPGGTHWYHSHMHRNSARQVGGGAFGLLIVEENPRVNPDVPLWASYERVLQIFRHPEVGYITNGEDIAEIDIERDRWFRLRVSIVDPLAVPDRFAIAGCQTMKIAHDGIWASTVPLPAQATYLLAGSSRADFVVRCDSAGEFPIRFRGRTVGRIISGATISQPIDLFRWRPTLPRSLSGLREANVPRQNTYEIFMSEGGINNISWNQDVPLHTIAYDQVHEWTIRRSEIHAFHKHLYHVMVVSPGGCGEMHQEGEIYDTISGVDSTGVCRIRFRTADFGQRELLHCHVLEHSDQGAMGWVNVVGPNMPVNNVRSPPYQCRRPVNEGGGNPGGGAGLMSTSARGCGTNGCDQCEGDCDNDNDCAGGLRCFQRVRFEAVPGCGGVGSGRGGWDYCYDGGAGAAIAVKPPTPRPTRGVDIGDGAGLRTIGRDGCGPNGCDECEGDCDVDGDCAGGLQCFHRINFEAVPGCGGGGESRFDYCYDSSAPGESINIPTPRPTPRPTRGVDTGGGAGLRTIGRDGCGPNGCGECEGDCDFDGDCAGDLRCFQRLGLEAVPGCGGIGGGQNGFDYCYDSSAPGGSINIPTPRPTPGPTRGVDIGDGAGLRTIGRDGCGPNGCGECEGDCDFDGDCAGDLRCFQRLGLEAVPGCGGIGGGQNGFDYCHDSSAPGGGAAAVLGGGTFEEEIGEAFRGGVELSSTNESCEICSDDPPNMGIQCDDESTITIKCNKSNRWRTEKFCKSSCYDIGLGYDNIVCC